MMAPSRGDSCGLQQAPHKTEHPFRASKYTSACARVCVNLREIRGRQIDRHDRTTSANSNRIVSVGIGSDHHSLGPKRAVAVVCSREELVNCHYV